MSAYVPDQPDNPALVYRRSSTYPRSREATGQDLAWEANQDLEVTRSGDLALLSGTDLIVQALLRRLYTPPDGYRRWLRDSNGLRVVDVEYGNAAYRYLSAPASSTAIPELQDAIWNCALQERRVELLRLVVQPSLTSPGRVEMELVYRIRGEEELRTLRQTLSEAPSSTPS